MAKANKANQRASELKDWIGEVRRLVHQVRAWSEDRAWLVNETEKQIEESAYGSYMVPELMIRSPSGPVYLEPVARDVVGAKGRVDLLAWPSLTRMMLVRKGNRWVLQTDSGVDWPERWEQRTFEKIVGLINAAA